MFPRKFHELASQRNLCFHMLPIDSKNLALTSRSDPASSPAPVSTCGSSQLPGLPLVSTTNVMTTQTSTLTTPGLASAIVQESLGAAQSSLSGELQVVTPVVPAQLSPLACLLMPEYRRSFA